MEQKMIASEVFKDKKDNYPQSVPKLFVRTRLSKDFTITPLLQLLYCMYKAVNGIFSWLDGEDINPKVLQALGSEKMKVGPLEMTQYQ